MKLLTAGQSKPLDFRTADGRLALQIRIDRHDEGVSIVVTQPTATTLNRTFTNDRLVEGRAYVALIRDMARAGRPVRDIEAAAGALTTAAAIVNEAAQDLTEPTNLAAFRQAAPKSATEGRVHTKPLTQSELGRVRSHVDGVVTTQPGQPWTMLRAIVRRGYGTPVYGRGTRIIAVQLNQRGLTAAGQNIGVAA
jgi:hypothetical protein